MKKVELLSPVGNKDMLLQAIHNGADAIYLAGTKYGARKFADNFTETELVEAINYAHLYGVKVYVTVNTLIYENEVTDVIDYLGFLHKNNVDAVIMQDIGLIKLTREVYPNLEIHASTQCHNHNKEIISLFKSLGIPRVVLARELSLSEIKKIDIEKEVFVYGALCVCYSGCCLFSSLNGGRSGNRGECVGSCRLPYKLIKNNEEVKTLGSYLLSTKELNTLNHLKELIEAGVASFKIEGRMKSPAYVGYVTRLYRTLIDKYYNNEELTLTMEELTNLKKLFNRKFTVGYLFDDKEIMNIKTPNHLGIEIGKVIAKEKDKLVIKLTADELNQNDGIRFKDKNNGMIVNRLYNKKGLLTNHVGINNICLLDNNLNIKVGDTLLKTIDGKLVKNLEVINYKKIPVTMQIECYLNQNIKLTVQDNENEIVIYGPTIELAKTSSVNTEDIKRQLSKLGNTPFILTEFQIQKDENIFINLKTLNELRREAINQLMTKRTNNRRKYQKNKLNVTLPKVINDNKFYVHVLVRNEEQLQCCLEAKVNDIYVTDYHLYLKYKHLNNIYYRLDRVNLNYQEFKNEKLLATELGSVNKYHKTNTIIGDYYLNVTNSNSLKFLTDLNVERVTLSVELDDHKLKSLMSNNYPAELIVYGRLELMIMKYCPLKETLNYCSTCKKNQDTFCLKDKFGNNYPMVRQNCLTHIMHHQIINKLENISNYKKMGIHHFRLELFDESPCEIKKLISLVRDKLS